MKPVRSSLWMSFCILIFSQSIRAQFGTGEISGVVTDPSGAAISQAEIKIRNEANGQIKTILTDDQGRYQLTYTDGRPGCVVGKCRIHITTAVVENPDDRDGAQFLKKVRDRVPAKYSSVKTELVREVQLEGGEENFELTSH